MARKIVAGNWKMNLILNEAKELCDGINNSEPNPAVERMVFPSHILASTVRNELSHSVRVGVQNFNAAEKGAHTGETSLAQAESIGVDIVLIGHSERRSMYGETNAILKAKVDAAVQQGMDFIFCCGEPLEVRQNNGQNNYVRAQLEESLLHISSEQINGQIIAYEPVWAIGTGKTASAEQAEEMHAAIRSWLVDRYDEKTAQNIAILYGGSCSPSNAPELFACPNVDGGLIGGASLTAKDFASIARAFE